LSTCRDRFPSPDNEYSITGVDFPKDFDECYDNDDAARLMESLLPPPPPMSTMERARRLHEIQLLEQLEQSDDASEALWELFFSERGVHKQKLLGATDQLLANPETWKQCEEELRKLIEDARSVAEDDDRRPGVYFVEAVNRLATLYFLQGRLDDSYTLCRLVLHLKLWHFGALSGIVQVCIGLSHREEARFWAQKRMPTLVAGTSFPPFTEKRSNGAASNPRRIEWCRQAIRNARARLKKAERNTTKSMGAPEDYYYQAKKRNSPPYSVFDASVEEPTDGQENAWQ
jgi:hypothetical protein